jgi:cyclic pyranopterin phosphate synthase
VNVSVDSLDSDVFKRITGTDRFEQVIAGVDEAVRVGFEAIKVNAVLLRETTQGELGRFMEWVKARPVSVRFIELMRTGKNAEYFSQQHLSGGVVQLELLKAGWTQMPRSSGDGPAVVYRHPAYVGSIGIIAPYSKEFCNSCNRLRVSSRGALRLCLFGERDESLRDYLQDDSSEDELIARIQELVLRKPLAHQLHEGKYGNTWNLAGIGG